MQDCNYTLHSERIETIRWEMRRNEKTCRTIRSTLPPVTASIDVERFESGGPGTGPWRHRVNRTYVVHKKNADDRQANGFRSHDGGGGWCGTTTDPLTTNLGGGALSGRGADGYVVRDAGDGGSRAYTAAFQRRFPYGLSKDDAAFARTNDGVGIVMDATGEWPRDERAPCVRARGVPDETSERTYDETMVTNERQQNKG